MTHAPPRRRVGGRAERRVSDPDRNAPGRRRPDRRSGVRHSMDLRTRQGAAHPPAGRVLEPRNPRIPRLSAPALGCSCDRECRAGPRACQLVTRAIPGAPLSPRASVRNELRHADPLPQSVSDPPKGVLQTTRDPRAESLHGGGVELDTVASCSLRVVHGEVSLLNEFRRIGVWVRRDDGADAACDRRALNDL